MTDEGTEPELPEDEITTVRQSLSPGVWWSLPQAVSKEQPLKRFDKWQVFEAPQIPLVLEDPVADAVYVQDFRRSLGVLSAVLHVPLPTEVRARGSEVSVFWRDTRSAVASVVLNIDRAVYHLRGGRQFAVGQGTEDWDASTWCMRALAVAREEPPLSLEGTPSPPSLEETRARLRLAQDSVPEEAYRDAQVVVATFEPFAHAGLRDARVTALPDGSAISFEWEYENREAIVEVAGDRRAEYLLVENDEDRVEESIALNRAGEIARWLITGGDLPGDPHQTK